MLEAAILSLSAGLSVFAVLAASHAAKTARETADALADLIEQSGLENAAWRHDLIYNWSAHQVALRERIADLERQAFAPPDQFAEGHDDHRRN